MQRGEATEVAEEHREPLHVEQATWEAKAKKVIVCCDWKLGPQLPALCVASRLL